VVQVQLLTAWVASGYVAVRRRLTGNADDRGDVPGWVMVTVMTAALVVAILGVFRGRITDAVNHALDSVTGKAGG
jgi:hypothetical protein